MYHRSYVYEPAMEREMEVKQFGSCLKGSEAYKDFLKAKGAGLDFLSSDEKDLVSSPGLNFTALSIHELPPSTRGEAACELQELSSKEGWQKHQASISVPQLSRFYYTQTSESLDVYVHVQQKRASLQCRVSAHCRNRILANLTRNMYPHHALCHIRMSVV